VGKEVLLMIEVIATSVDDAIAIEKYGGMRIELSSALSEMGITFMNLKCLNGLIQIQRIYKKMVFVI
jgi:copper homeostasis protein CutC